MLAVSTSQSGLPSEVRLPLTRPIIIDKRLGHWLDLWDAIRACEKKRNSLTSVSDEQAILSFINRVQEPYVHHKLGRKQVAREITTMSRLMKLAKD